MTENKAEQLRAIFTRDGNEKWFPEKNERFIAAIAEVIGVDTQAIVRSSILAYKCALAGFQCEPGYTEHELMAWEIGRKEGGWEGKH